jgi:diketogulonate reductase-like aldo/keto reductase
MLTRPIPSTGEALPVVGLGTWETFDIGSDPAARTRLEEVLGTFVTLGGTLVDSSPMYGRAEEVLGDVAGTLGLRPKLFVATKVWTSGRAAGVRQMEASERRLRARPIDLMQVHNLLDMDVHQETLAAWKQEGRVRYVGITHYTASGHEAVARAMAAHAVDFVQINYSVGEREAENRILPMALDRGIAVIVNRPFATGALLRRLTSRPLPPWAGEIGCASWAELLLKFVVSHPAVTCVIPATADPAHMRENMRAGLGPVPDQALRERIAAAVV